MGDHFLDCVIILVYIVLKMYLFKILLTLLSNDAIQVGNFTHDRIIYKIESFLKKFFLTPRSRSQLCSNLENMHKPNFTWDWSGFDGIVRDNVSSSSAGAALTLLALCYLPGERSCVTLGRGSS